MLVYFVFSFNKVRLSLIRLGEVCLFHNKYYFIYCVFYFHWLVVGFSVCFACLFYSCSLCVIEEKRSFAKEEKEEETERRRKFTLSLSFAE